ncbi:hypothetical protein ACHHRT_01545 [Desulfurivibrio sp. D14AmB]|uniref:hypothetical protein n=1 Tax=Desulfurivibrio sp. D14AmB TaxID=3374370 RepID=UPI00376F1BF5
MNSAVPTKETDPQLHPDRWWAVQEWVDSHVVLIKHIAEPYRRYMASDFDDLRQEAYLAAHEALVALDAAGVVTADTSHPEFPAYFRVKMRNHCIALSSVGQTPNKFDPERVPVPGVEHLLEKIEEEKISHDLALRQARLLPDRQKQVAMWVLTQPYPVSNQEISARFNLCDRYVRQVVNWSSDTIAARSKIFHPMEI